MGVSSESKSVKFTAKTPNSDRKKFAKTPHSTKTPKEEPEGAEQSIMLQKKRKLSFSNLEENSVIPSPKTPKRTPEKPKAQTPGRIKADTPASVKKNKLRHSLPAKIDRKSLNNASPAVNNSSKKKQPEAESEDDDDEEESDEDDVSEEIEAGESDDDDESGEEEEDESDDEGGEEDESTEENEDKSSENEEDDEDESESEEESPAKPTVAAKNKGAKSKDAVKAAELKARAEIYKAMTPEEKKRHKKERTVLIGNLPASTTREQLIKEFKRFGKIQSARLRGHTLKDKVKNRKAGVILKQYEDLPIVGFIKFFELESAKACTEMNGKLFKGLHLRVEVDDPVLKRPQDKSKAVFLGNLPFDILDEELWKTFEGCGKINNIRILRDKLTHRGKGIAYVNFDSPASVELALKLHQTEIRGRPINVVRSEPRQMQKGKKPNPKAQAKPKNVEGKKNQKPKAGNVQAKKQAPKTPASPNNFAGKQAQQKNKKKAGKPSAETLKKKKVAEILTKKNKK